MPTVVKFIFGYVEKETMFTTCFVGYISKPFQTSVLDQATVIS